MNRQQSYRILHTEIDINASAPEVWRVLVNWSEFPDWAPFITYLSGEQHIGAKLKAELEQKPGSKMVFTPKVVVWEAGRHFAWKGKLGISGFFDGEHHFRLEPLPNGMTRLHHYEHFSGILVPLFRNMLAEVTPIAFRAFNEALKSRVEAR